MQRRGSLAARGSARTWLLGPRDTRSHSLKTRASEGSGRTPVPEMGAFPAFLVLYVVLVDYFNTRFRLGLRWDRDPTLVDLSRNTWVWWVQDFVGYPSPTRMAPGKGVPIKGEADFPGSLPQVPSVRRANRFDILPTRIPLAK